MMHDPFYTRDGDLFLPTPAAHGPWSQDSLHGRAVIGLLAVVIEARHGADDFMPARLTVDMFRLPTTAPVQIVTRVIRSGLRIRLIEAEFVSAGASMARATCQMLRRTENPAGTVWSPPNWRVPAPADIPPPGDPRSGHGGRWATRPITGAMGTRGPRQLWMSEVREMVGGMALTPFARVAAAADYASPFANAGDHGLGYINTDVTLYLHRLPMGEWIGFEVVNHHATDGVAIGECFLYDETGPIGSATVAALGQRKVLKPKTQPPPQ